MTMQTSYFYCGNTIIDGGGGWFFGNRQPAGFRHHENVFVKYGLHQAGETCDHPYDKEKQLKKMNISILIAGGPFVHHFRRRDNDADIPEAATLISAGDYLVYNGTDLTHTWKALRETTVLTIQFEP